jgi:hypothetical protein
VQPYAPRDAVKYAYQTTIEGVIEKEDSTNDEFIVPKELTRVYNQLASARLQGASTVKAQFGNYAENGTIPTCFITTNDITGGNSGSPCLNANGELLGLAFDGNWESMTGDLQFDNQVQRTIVVDIRYVLTTIDKMFHAQRLMNELTIAPPMAETVVQPMPAPLPLPSVQKSSVPAKPAKGTPAKGTTRS